MEDSSSLAQLVQVPELVGISYDVDGGDLAVLDIERRRLELAIGLERDDAGQSVDEAGTNESRRLPAQQDGRASDRITAARGFACATGSNAADRSKFRHPRPQAAYSRISAEIAS